MKLSTLIWSILGVSVAINAFFCIAVIEFFADKAYFEAYKWHSCAALILGGIALSLLGWWKASHSGESDGGEEGTAGPEPAIAGLPSDSGDSRGLAGTALFGLLKPLFWGPMLICFGVIVMCIVPTPSVQRFADRISTNLVQRARLPKPLPETNLPPVTSAPPALVTFPDVTLQGVIYRPANPSVVVHGRAYFVGDYLGDAVIVAIERDGATLALGNHQRKVFME